MSEKETEVLLIDVDDLAKMMSVSKRTALRMDSSGKLPAPVRPCRNRRWRVSELRDWVNFGCPPRVKWDAIKSRA